MNIFLFVLSTVIFFASFPMFAYSFVVPEAWAAWLFGAGVLTSCLAFVIPMVFLGRSER
jgi:hypothetical protein